MTQVRKPTRLQLLWAEMPKRASFVRNGLILFAFLAFIAAVVLMPRASRPLPPWAQNAGFGPGWDCTNNGRGEPICIKRAPAASEPPPTGAVTTSQ